MSEAAHFAEIRLILLREWDPIGITHGRDYDEATDDEYDSYAREIWQGSGLFHMFVVVTPSLGAPPTARFSYGPSVDISLFPPAGPGSLVEQRGSGSITDIGDTGAYRDFANGRAGDGPAVFGARINASDAAVIKSGNAIDAKLGDRANPTGAVEYLVAPNAISAVVNPNAANSNSAAMAVANGALGNGQQQPLPKGVSAPGWGQSRIVTNAQSHNNVPDFSHGHCPAAQPGLSCGGEAVWIFGGNNARRDARIANCSGGACSLCSQQRAQPGYDLRSRGIYA